MPPEERDLTSRKNATAAVQAATKAPESSFAFFDIREEWHHKAGGQGGRWGSLVRWASAV